MELIPGSLLQGLAQKAERRWKDWQAIQCRGGRFSTEAGTLEQRLLGEVQFVGGPLCRNGCEALFLFVKFESS